MTTSINIVIRDLVNAHSADLMRYEAAHRKKVLSVLSKMERDAKKKIFKHDPTQVKHALARQKRIERLMVEVERIADESYSEIDKITDAELNNLGNAEADFMTGMIEDSTGLPRKKVYLSEKKVENIVNDTLIQGASNEEWWNLQKNKTYLPRFKQQMRMGLLEGDTIQKMARRIRQNVMLATRQQSETLVRTAFHAVASKTRFETLSAMDDVVESLQWTSTLDTRTTDICKARDGKLYAVDTMEPVGHSLPALGGPGAAHWGCRSGWSPVTKSWEDLLGVKGVDDIPGKTRRSMDGLVPDKLDYEAWLKTQPEGVQITALGRKRWELWKDGKISSFTELVGQDGRARSLIRKDGKWVWPSSRKKTARKKVVSGIPKEFKGIDGATARGNTLSVPAKISKSKAQAMIESVESQKHLIPDHWQERYNYTLAAVKDIKKGALGVIHFDDKGLVRAAASLKKKKDTIDINLVGSMIKGGGDAVFYNSVKYSEKLGLNGALELYSIGDVGTIGYYDRVGFDSMPGQNDGRRLWLSPDEAKEFKKLVEGKYK